MAEVVLAGAVDVEFTAFCCAQAVTVNADSKVKVMQFLISTFLEWSSTPHHGPLGVFLNGVNCAPPTANLQAQSGAWHQKGAGLGYPESLFWRLFWPTAGFSHKRPSVTWITAGFPRLAYSFAQSGGTMPAHTSLEVIEDFLAQKRIAMVGASRDPGDFSILLFKELCRRGYNVVPVNPQASEILGQRCFKRVQDIQPPVDAALLMTSPLTTDAVVADCAEAGIRRIWMYRAAGDGAVSANAVQLCQEKGIQLIPGECPFMFLPGNGFHALHGFIRKITGSFPKRSRATKRAA
ncbi:MAG TPA: CoA-binding protein [Candidatus Sulfotelmatobacter sp.]|nr:CoA-binding protein [Candidatus Sulfotelmatobacter sp.]